MPPDHVPAGGAFHEYTERAPLAFSELTRRLDDLGFTARTSTPAGLAEWVRKEIQRWNEVAKAAAAIRVD